MRYAAAVWVARMPPLGYDDPSVSDCSSCLPCEHRCRTPKRLRTDISSAAARGMVRALRARAPGGGDGGAAAWITRGDNA